jgi:uncharacterized protein (TIGR02001 family)
MWAALSNGDAMAVDIAPRRTALCDAAYVDVFDCAERDLADARDMLPVPASAHLPAVDDLGAKAPPASAPNISPLRITYTLTLASDYLRGGVSRTDGKPALQGIIDFRTHDRWSFGARGSNIAKHGNLEIALYGTKTIELGNTDLTFGVTANTYPRDPHGDYLLLQTSASRAIGPFDVTASIIYAPTQDHLDGEDNFYAVVRARTPIGTLLGAPVTLNGSIGRMRGHFADAHSRSDWSLGLVGRVAGVDIGLTYADNDLGDSRGHPRAVFSITHSF